MNYSEENGIFNLNGRTLVCEVIDTSLPIPEGYSMVNYSEYKQNGLGHNWKDFTVLVDPNGKLVSNSNNKNLRPVYRGDNLNNWFYLAVEFPPANVIVPVEHSEIVHLCQFCTFPLLEANSGNYIWKVRVSGANNVTYEIWDEEGNEI